MSVAKAGCGKDARRPGRRPCVRKTGTNESSFHRRVAEPQRNPGWVCFVGLSAQMQDPEGAKEAETAEAHFLTSSAPRRFAHLPV
jgi:hypothetical protein